MSNHYKALTRKYRPSCFDDIVSQGHVSHTLKNAIEQKRLSHAYLFSGPRGVGKTTMARVLARAINNVDISIDAEQLNQTLNIVEIDAASNNSVDDARHIREQVRIPPQNGDYKVFIIDEVHMLSKAAFNALLKTLEEPPSYAIFIFATTEPHKVLPTILSRVQRFDFKRLSVDEISARIQDIAGKEGISIDDESVNILARRADGALRDALGLMDQAIALCGLTIEAKTLQKALNVIGMDRLYALVEKIIDQKPHEVLLYIDELLHDGYDLQELVVNLTEYLRNLYIAFGGQNLNLIESTESVKSQLISLAKKLSEEDILRYLHLCSDLQQKLKDAHQPRIQLEIAFLKMANMPKSKSVSQLLALLEEIKKKGLNLEDFYYKEDPKITSEESTVEEKAVELPSKSLPKEFVESESNEEIEKVLLDVKLSDVAEEDVKHSLEVKAPVVKTEKLEEKAESVGLNRLFNKTYTEQKNAISKIVPREKPIAFLEIEEGWGKWATQLTDAFSNHLKRILVNASPRELNRHKLTIKVDDHFTKEMIDSNAKLIEQALLSFYNAVLTLDCHIEHVESTKVEHLDPIDQLMKLQQTEPKIKTIVELFGAEPDF